MLKFRIIINFKSSATLDDVKLNRHVINELQEKCLAFASSSMFEMFNDMQCRVDINAYNVAIAGNLTRYLLGCDNVDTYYITRINDYLPKTND
jgi:hypothetical protein